MMHYLEKEKIKEYLSSIYIKHMNGMIKLETFNDHDELLKEPTLFEFYKDKYKSEFYHLFAKYGMFDELEKLKEKKCIGSKNSLFYFSAIRGRRLDVLKWLRENGIYHDSNDDLFYTVLSEYGVVEIADWMFLQKDITFKHISEWKYHSDLSWLHNDNFKYILHHKGLEMRIAARHGHLDLLKWFVAHDFPKNYDVIYEAICSENLEITKWMMLNGFPIKNSMLMYEEFPKKYSTYVVGYAAKYGKLEFLKKLKIDGFVFNDLAITGAVLGKQFNIVEWLFRNNCPYCSVYTFRYAGDKLEHLNKMYLEIFAGDEIKIIKWKEAASTWHYYEPDRYSDPF